MKEKSMVTNMTEGSVLSHLVRFALPLLLANCLQTLYTTVDTLVVGRFVGTAGLSAVSTCGDLITFYTMIAMGFTSGGQIIIAQFVGKNDREAISKTIGTLFTLLIGAALVLTVFCITALDWQLSIMNVPTEALTEGRYYTLICGAGLIFVFGYNGVSAVLRGLGDSKRPLLFIGIASFANLILDLLFVVGFHMGAAGAALATILGQAFSLIASLLYLYRHRESFGFDFKLRSFIPVKKYLSMLIRLGGPMALQFALVLISVIFISAQINNFGVAASAANGVASKLENIIRIVSNSVGTAASAMIAQNIAARKINRCNKILGYSMCICITWAAICSVAIYLFPQQIFSVFNTDSRVLEYALIFAPAGVVCYLGNGIRSTANALINGIGHATLSLIAGLLDSVVARIGFSLLFAHLMPPELKILGFWYGSALAGYVPILIGLGFYLSGKWKTRKLITQS